MKRSKKKQWRLNGRIYAWEQMKTNGGDTYRKHPNGFKKPGSMNK